MYIVFHSEDIGHKSCSQVAKLAKNVLLGSPICRGVRMTFLTCIFKAHLLPTMWPDMVELRSASCEDYRGKKNEEESVVKHKSTDHYVGRPN